MEVEPVYQTLVSVDDRLFTGNEWDWPYHLFFNIIINDLADTKAG